MRGALGQSPLLAGSLGRWALTAMLCLLAPQAARGASLYDPALEYRTVSTERFAVHYPSGAFNLAVRVGRLSEEVLRADAALLQFMPRGTIDIVLTDTSDAANGSAEVLPHNCLRLYLAAPSDLDGLNAHDDWLRMLITHELAHIVDIDHTEGIAGGMRRVFGKLISFNGSVPQYLSEGVAVWTETKLTDFGRGRSSYVDTVLRMAALDNKFIQLDQAHILFARYPMGSAAYYYGGRFHLYLSQRLGDDAVAALHTFYASQPIPWLYYFGAKRVFGKSLPALWRDFAADETRFAREVAQDVAARGITKSTCLFAHAGTLLGARYEPDSQGIVFSQASPEDGVSARRWRPAMGPRKSERLFRDTLSSRIAFDPLRRGDFLYAMASITNRFDSFADLFVYDAAKKRRTRLRDETAPKVPLRARHPAWRPDGAQVAFVQTKMQQSWLSVADIVRRPDGRVEPALRVRTLVPPAGEMQQASPAYSPDGRTLALSTFFGAGLRDIVLIDVHSGRLVRRITHDTAQDGNPVWSQDGRFVLYESDLQGISDLYAFEVATGRTFRVTQVVGGAFQPDVSPDGRKILFRQATGDGFALHEMLFEPARWQPIAYCPDLPRGDVRARRAPPLPAAAPMGGPSPPSEAAAGDPSAASVEAVGPAEGWQHEPFPPAAAREDEPRLALTAKESEGPYRPGRGLKPWGDNWLLVPDVYIYNNAPGIGLSTFAADSLQRHSYAAGVGGIWGVPRPSVSLGYANNVWLPTYSITGGLSNTPYRLATGRMVESSTLGGASVSWPWRRRHAVAVSYNFEHRWLQGIVPAGWPRGRFASLAASYSYGFIRNFPFSISYEAGHTFRLGAQAYARAVGGQYDQVVLSLDTRHFLPNPWLANHVLALRLVGNWAVGPDSVQKFFLYGTQAASFFTAQSTRLLPLRGFLPQYGVGAPSPGDGLAAAYAEYRFPLWHVQRGLFSWPLFFEHLHAAVFADAGNTLTLSPSADAKAVDSTASQFIRHLWVSAGAEVRLDLSLAWEVPLTLRVGLAQPMVARGVRVVDRAGPRIYFDVGTLF